MKWSGAGRCPTCNSLGLSTSQSPPPVANLHPSSILMATDSFHSSYPIPVLFTLLSWWYCWSTHLIMSLAGQNPAKSPLRLQRKSNVMMWHERTCNLLNPLIFSSHTPYHISPCFPWASPILKLLQFSKYIALSLETGFWDWLDSLSVLSPDPPLRPL